MNAFANALFTLLFGWIRSGVQILWNASTQGHLSGFFTWLGDHWLLVAVFLCLVCTVMDYLVWLVRWRPYLVWRTKMRRFFAALRGRTWTDSRQFDRGYEAGVQMEMDGLVPPEPIPEPPVYSPEEPEVYAPFQAEEPAVYQAPPAPPMDYAPLYTPPPAPLFPPVSSDDVPASGDEGERVRHRRSEKHSHSQPGGRWHERRLSDAGDDDGQEGLPPAVNQEDAFHDPVYPVHSDSGYWQGQNGRPAPGGKGSL